GRIAPLRGLFPRGTGSVAAFERRAQDVAQRRARFGRAVLVDGFLFLGDLAGLDRQAQTAGAGVHVGDAGIDRIADLEALGALVLTVAGQIRTADEGFHPVEFDLDAAVLDRGDGGGDDITPL